MKSRRNKYSIVVLTSFIFVSLITGVIYAWSDTSQHKTSTYTMASPLHNITLVEDFKSPQNWKQGESIVKKIFVKNGDVSEVESKFIYKPMFVRIQLREFLGYETQETQITENKYYQKNPNEFYKFDTEQDALDFAASLKLAVQQNRVEDLKGINDSNSKFYLRVFDEDDNTIDSNHLVLLKSTSNFISLETGDVVTKIESSDDKHNNNGINEQNLEDTILYKTHIWESGQASLTAENDIFSPFVTWNLGEDVISIDEWEANFQNQPVAKWIVDTDPFGEGWVYWGQPLFHTSISDIDSVTSNFMESVTLNERIEGKMEYRIHTNLDAVSFDEIDSWNNGPNSIKEMFKSTHLN